MAKRSLSFTFDDRTIVQLDRVRERCGCESYADVLGRALATFDTLTALASDGVGLIHVEAQPAGQQRLQSTVTVPQVVAAYERARELERVLDLPLPPIPEAVPAPPPAPVPAEPPRRWWWPWR